MERILGLVLSGFAIKAGGALLAIYVATTASEVFMNGMAGIKAGFALVP